MAGLSVESEVEPCGLIELYIALKSKPMAILSGPAGSGKLAAARTLATILAERGQACLQEMVGHAWWASRSGAVAMFSEAQQRFNRDKFLAIVEEAAAGRSAVYVALLSRISPAEWGYLAALAAEFRRGFVMGLAGEQRRPRLLVPRNVLLIATADRLAPPPWDSELLRSASILPWPSIDVTRMEGQTGARPLTDEGTPFLHAARRAPRAALRRLRGLPGWKDERLKPLLGLTRAMQVDGVSSANCVANEAIVYLANAWTWRGHGLFARSFEENFRQAMRLAVILAALPRLEGRPAPSAEVSETLAAIVGDLAAHHPPAANRERFSVTATDRLAWPRAGSPSSPKVSQEERRRFTMVKDPVCGMEVDPKTAAAQLEFEGRTYSFCSMSCKKTFEKEPRKYTAPHHSPAHPH